MALSFKRPVGAAVDVKELEYVSALHQTAMPGIREDASIHDVDIVFFLKSRYGIAVTPDYVRKTVMKGLGGGDEEDEAIDLVELVSIILIPLLIKASRRSVAKFVGEEEEKTKEDFEYAYDFWRYCYENETAKKLAPPENIIEEVFSLLMGGATGDPSPKKLDENLVRSLLSASGENDLANNNLLVKEMVSAATIVDIENGIEPVFDSKAFAHALAGDLEDYKVENEAKLTTTYFDVFGSHTYKDEKRTDTDLDHEQEALSSRPEKIKTEPMFASIDFVSENYQSKALCAAIWTGFLFTVFVYHSALSIFPDNLACAQVQNRSFGCKIAWHSLRWLEIFILIFVFGLVFIGFGSTGNEIQSKRKYLIIFGASVIVATIWISALLVPLPLEKGSVEFFLKVLTLVLSLLILLLQLMMLVGYYIPRRLLRASRMLEQWSTPGNVRAESLIKQAASYKLNHLVENARSLFGLSAELDNCQFSKDATTKALLNYGKKGKIFITQGGLIWTWRRILSQELFNENGIWISGRFIAGNFSQFILSVVIVVVGLIYAFRADHYLTPTFNDFTGFMKLDGNEIDGIANMTVEAMNDRIGIALKETISKELDKKNISESVRLARNLTETKFNDTIEDVLQYAYTYFRTATASFNCFVEENLRNECRRTRMRHLSSQTNQAYMMTGPAAENASDSIEHGIKQFHGSMIEIQTIATPQRQRSQPLGDSQKWSVSKISRNAQGLEICQEFDISQFCDSIEYFKNEAYDDFNYDEVFTGLADQAMLTLNRTVEGVIMPREEVLLEEVIQVSQTVSANTIDKLKPDHVYMITVPLYIGVFAAFLTIIYVAVSLVPSAVTTTLRFRSGMIPTFRDPNFSNLRSGQQAVTMILGYIFWGGFVSSFMLGVLVAFGAFLFMYQVTRAIIFSFAAVVVGIAITIGFRTALVLLCKMGLYKGFYRIHPARANITMLGLESTNVATSIFFVVVRFGKLIALALMYIGRIDTPFLAPGVGCIGPVNLDSCVTMFWKTILAHEAHRHPYIETLGSMYLMKLYHGDKFAKTSGSCWRVLFVLTLMPWLQKYRIMTRRPALKEAGSDNSDDDFSVAADPLNKCASKEYSPSGINEHAEGTGEIESMVQLKSLLQEEIAKLKEEKKLLEVNTGPATHDENMGIREEKELLKAKGDTAATETDIALGAEDKVEVSFEAEAV